MRKSLYYSIFTVVTVLLFTNSFAQQQSSQTMAAPLPSFESAVPTGAANHLPKHLPAEPLSAQVAIGGTVPLGLNDKFHGGSLRGGLHNIAVDPSDPNKLHAAVMFAQNVDVDDTVGSGSETFQQLRVYYMYSADGGASWSTPKAVVNARTLSPELILYKRGTDYVPIIAAYRNVTPGEDSFVCAIYIETGAPGTGTFQEVRATRTTFNDEPRNIIWPSIAASPDGSKIYMVAGVSRPNTDDPFNYVQFGIFSMTESGSGATFSGWQAGPQDGPAGSLISVRVAPSGKIGVGWRNQNFDGPDLSLYLSESTDGGASWSSTPSAMMTEVGTTNQDANGDFYYLVPVYFDFWYEGESPRCVISGYYYNRNPTDGYYYPASGSLLFWKEGMVQAKLLVAKLDDNDLGASILDGSWLSEWNTQLGVDPQGRPNLMYPTVARTSDSNMFSIYFMAFNTNDIQDVGPIGEGTYSNYFYSSIWRTTTFNGGESFTEVEKVHANNPDDFEEAKYDYRHVQAATWNPPIPGGMNVHTIFAADSSAGECQYDELPGFVDVSWLFELARFSDVASSTTANALEARAYPNPFADKVTLSFSLDTSGDVSIEVVDLLGRVLVNEALGSYPSGTHSIILAPAGLPRGVHRFALRVGERQATGMLLKVK